jgi:hypothetical protein
VSTTPLLDTFGDRKPSRRFSPGEKLDAGRERLQHEIPGDMCFDILGDKQQSAPPTNSWPGALRAVRNGSVIAAAAAVVVSNTIAEPAATHLPLHVMGMPVNTHPTHGPESPNSPLSWERVEVQMISAGPPMVEWRVRRPN